MDASPQPQALGTRADGCINDLQALRRRAETRFSTTNVFLTDVIHKINDSLLSLQTWRTDSSKETLTERDTVVKDAARLLDTLRISIEYAATSLRSRLRYRRRYIIGLIPGKRQVLHQSHRARLTLTSTRRRLEECVTRALTHVHDTIAELQAWNKALLETSSKQANLHSRKRNLLADRTQSYNAFSEFFNNLRVGDPQTVRSQALEMLWRYFPQPRESLEGMVGNAVTPGDGLLYDVEQIDGAKALLAHLHHAWCNMNHNTQCPSPPNIANMPKICFVLTGMQQQHLLKDFIDHNVQDSDLPLEKHKIEQVLGMENCRYASTFFTEQHRAVPRTWDEGHHLEVEEEEPLPLRYIAPYHQGSYGMVTMVQDPLTQVFYARKQQLLSAEEHENAATRKHLEEETKRLRNLRHKHVVQLVKTYQRGRAYGMILKPAATSDLERLILRYYDNRFDANNNCKPRDWLGPLFLHAFGCLSKGLEYIHRRDIRHKDVKPANILYEKALGGHKARLLWADFGLAYDFSATGNSKTKSAKVYSQRYAAPEILAASTRLVSNGRTTAHPALDSSIPDGEEAVVDAQIESDFKETEETGHGRMTDVFSLGCVFLELLACLLDDRLPMDAKAFKDPREPPKNTEHLPQEVRMFSQYILELKEWARQRGESDIDGKLKPLLKLAVKMISRTPGDRPPVADVVRDVALAGRHHFCDVCWKDHEGDRVVKDSNGLLQGYSVVEESSSKESPKRVNSAPHKGPVDYILARVNSGTRPQMKRIFPTLP
ncbi:MAG: hypothetical protein Q9181_004099 [Wetmoreana brouardii]